MVETRFAALADEQLRYGDHTWALTGAAELRGSGEQLALEARQVDGVAHEHATLAFDVRDPPASPNPGNLGSASARLEPEGDGYALVVTVAPRTYRYELRRIEY